MPASIPVVSSQLHCGRVQLHEAFATGNQLERSAGCTDELKNLWINAEQYGALKATRNAMRRSRRDYMNVGGLRDLMLREKKTKRVG
jgi:hypothetical protein